MSSQTSFSLLTLQVNNLSNWLKNNFCSNSCGHLCFQDKRTGVGMNVRRKNDFLSVSPSVDDGNEAHIGMAAGRCHVCAIMRLTRTRAANDKCIGSNTEKRRIYTQQHAALIRIEDNLAAALAQQFSRRAHTHTQVCCIK